MVRAKIVQNISFKGPAKCTTSCAHPMIIEYAMKNETIAVHNIFKLFIFSIV